MFMGKLKIVVVLLVVIAAGILSGCTTREELNIHEGDNGVQQMGPVFVGYGWSIKSDPVEAVAEAVSSVKTQLKDKTPDYIVLFSTVDYNSTVILGEVSKYFPEAQIYGGTSCTGVLTKDGYHTGGNGSLALLAVSSENISFGVGGAEIGDSARTAGAEAISEAIVNAGRNNETPDLVLITAAPGKEEEILLGIEDVIGKDTPIFGGSSADNTIEGYWKEFANNKVYSNGVSVTAIFTNLKIGYSFEAGYLISEQEGIITEAEGRTIYKIDDKPAAEVYNNWTSGEVIGENHSSTGELIILSQSTFYPLSKKLVGSNGEIHYLSIHPLSVNFSDKSLTVFANVENGETIQLMHGTWELLLNRGHSTPSKALEFGEIDKGKGAFGIYTFCGGTLLGIPENERFKLPLLVYQTIGIPFIGTFTFGEQGYISGVGNRHGNLVNSMVIIGEEEK